MPLSPPAKPRFDLPEAEHTFEHQSVLGDVAHLKHSPALPLVSVIVVNFNYGRYLRQAIASVFAQDYSRIECIVVDNASTDGSLDIIETCRAAHPSLQVVRRAENGGQTAAAIEGLSHARGPYVIFLDADDYLLERCATVHMQVHLSTRVHVGFTCADMLQVIAGDQVVLSTNEPMATHLLGGHAGRRDLLRPSRAGLGELWARLDPDLSSRVHLVSRRQKHWVWSPTSGTCFRRDALDLFCDKDGLDVLRAQTDLYLAFGINAVSGSILIDEPLFAYRLHGSNAFSSKPQLSGCLSFDPKRTSQNTELARRLLIDQLVTRVERFVPQQWLGFAFLRTLHHVDIRDGRHRSYAARAVAAAYPAIAEAVGPWLAFLFLAVKGAPLRTLYNVLRAGPHGRNEAPR